MKLYLKVVALLTLVVVATTPQTLADKGDHQALRPPEVPISTPLDKPFFENVLSDRQSTNADRMVHQVPTLPLMIDGVYYNPEEIHRFDGQALHFFVDKGTLEQELLFAFTTKAQLWDYIESLGYDSRYEHLERIETPSPRKSSAASSAGTAYFYEHTNWHGSVLPVDCGFGVTFGSSFWNNRISSVLGYSGISVVTLYDGNNFTGSSLTLGDNESISQSTLHSGFGWGDRAGSVVVFCAVTSLDLTGTPYYASGYRVGLAASWNAVTGATSYRVTHFRQDDCGSASITHTQTGTTSGSGTHANCGAPSSCYYRETTVDALDSQGGVITSETVSFCEVGNP